MDCVQESVLRLETKREECDNRSLTPSILAFPAQEGEEGP